MPAAKGRDIMQRRVIGVLAATPIDTAMGVDVVKSAGFSHVSRYLSPNPAEQTKLQVLETSKLTEMTLALCEALTEEGAEGIFLYCNSLAGAIDMQGIRARLSVRIVTPLDVYAHLAGEHSSIAVLAANCQSLAAIERTMRTANPNCAVYGSGLLPLVEKIESGASPEAIVDELKMAGLVRALCSMGGEILVLGCTHFAYLAEQITAVSDLPVIDPARTMLGMLA